MQMSIIVCAGVAATVALGAVYLWMSQQENKMLNDYNELYDELTAKACAREKQIADMQKQMQDDVRYYKAIKLHHASHLIGGQIYQMYEQQKQPVKMLKGKIDEWRKNIMKLKILRDNSSGEQNKIHHSNLLTARKYLSQAKDELQKIYAKKDGLYALTQSTNSETRRLKMYRL